MVGYLGADAKTGITAKGVPWFEFRMATREEDPDPNNPGQFVEVTEWHICKAQGTRYNPTIEKWGKRGRQVYVEGAYRTRKYMHKDGFERHIAEVRVTLIRFLGSPDAINLDERTGMLAEDLSPVAGKP